MKGPTTSPARRVYRGAPKPLAPGACPHCGKEVSINRSGRRHSHMDGPTRCTGSGILVGDRTTHLDVIPPVKLPQARKPPARRGSAQGRPSSRVTLASDGTTVDYSGRGDLENTAHGRGECDACGRHLPFNNDGTIRRHRVRHQDPLAPYCEGTS